MTKKQKQALAFAVIMMVLIVKFFNQRVNDLLWDDSILSNFYLRVVGQILYYLIPTLIILLLFHRPSQIFGELGLHKDFLIGLGYAFLITLPMLLGYFVMGHYNKDYSILRNIVFAFKDGFREEIFYRAFLFGQLFRQAKWGFIPAVAINGIIFGLSHLYQAHNIVESVGIVFITFAGAVWFAWLFIEWKDNLWLPIFTHFLMNFYWEMFTTEKSAFGGIWLNIPRFVTIGLSIFITIQLVKKKSERFRINKGNLWSQRI